MNNPIFRILLITLTMQTAVFSQERSVRQETLADGVVRYYRPAAGDESSWFFAKMEQLYAVIMGAPEQLPFGRSVAFLTGVDKYANFDDLPSVKRDLQQMKDFLLDTGGFDEVFVAQGTLVNRNLIEKYIKGTLPTRLGKRDRLLFYYSGHGADNDGATGYMRFEKAERNKFWGDQVLAINDVHDWSKEIKVRHLLFLFDCCASGLAFGAKGDDDCDRSILSTLSGNGSRVVMTAGTADQKTYALEGRENSGNGVFTRAFLKAFQNRNGESGRCGMFTAHEIHAAVEKEIGKFAGRYGKKLTPKIWVLEDDAYQGTFVFLNPRGGKLNTEQARAIGAIEKGGTPSASYGDVRLVFIGISGTVLIDGQPDTNVEDGDALDRTLESGEHTIAVRRDGQILLRKTIHVSKGRNDRPAIFRGSDREPPDPGPKIDLRKFEKIEAGSFTMGDDNGSSDEKPAHTVRISKAFYMGKYEVTVGEFRAFVNATGYKTEAEKDGGAYIYADGSWGYKADANWRNPYLQQSGDHPVVCVSWNDAIAYCNWRSEQEKLRPVYQISGVEVKIDYNANGYRLPTEAEWEYACRAGSSGDYAGTGNLDAMGWYWDNANKTTHPVGKKQANRWKLHDMHGNVWEWCNDWYNGSYYGSSPGADPQGPAAGSYRVLRGGGWSDIVPRYCRSANRNRNLPGYRNGYVGFRLLRAAY